MAQLDDFSKIYHGSKSIARVYGGKLVGSNLRDISTNNRGIKVTASTTLTKTSVNMLFDGIIGDDTNRWVSTENDTQPKLTITLDKPYGISQINIHNGLAGNAQYFVEDVEIIIDGINQGTFIGKKSPIDINFVDEPTGKVIELKFPAGYNRIYEIEIYGKEHFSLIWQEEPDVYLAQDSDFVKVDGYWVYRGASKWVEIPTHINGELVTSTQYMFNGGATYQATPVTKVVLKHSNVTNMSFMFRQSSATTLDLSSFNTSNVIDMSSMFSYSSVTTLDLSSFDTSNVTNMSFMFRPSSVTTLDLSSFNTSNVTNMYFMFADSSATTLDLSGFDTSNVINMDYMFYNSKVTTGYARTQADANKFNASGNKPAGLNFVVKSDVYLAQDSDFVNVNNYWVYRGAALEVEIPTHINGQVVTSTAFMFNGSSNATPVTKVVLNHSNVTDMRYMFDSSKATTLDLSSFDTSKVTDMNSMFSYSSATTLDLSSFNTSNVTDMRVMFKDSSATTLDLSSFDTSNVTTMYGMFYNSKATTLDLSSFNTSNVTSMSSMFDGSKATTGYARTQADADRFNASSYKPAGLNFVVKP